MAYISKKVREQLDEAGFTEAKIYASNDLDESTILSLKMQKAKIDVWGVGTKLITAYDQPALGAVYKLVSIENEQGEMIDTIKLSGNAEKVSTPGKKQVWRITRKKDGKSVHTFINKTVTDFDARPLLQDIFVEGQQVYQLPDLEHIKAYATNCLDSLWDEYKRDLNPQKYPVDLSQECWNHKMRTIEKVRTQTKTEII